MTYMRSIDVDINNVKISSEGLKCYFYYWAKRKTSNRHEDSLFLPNMSLKLWSVTSDVYKKKY